MYYQISRISRYSPRMPQPRPSFAIHSLLQNASFTIAPANDIRAMPRTEYAPHSMVFIVNESFYK